MWVSSSSSSSSSSCPVPKNEMQRLHRIRSQSIDGLLTGSCEKTRHRCRDPLPALRLFFDLLLAQPAQRVVLGTTVIFRGSPLGRNPATLLEAKKCRIDGPLIQIEGVVAHLLDA